MIKLMYMAYQFNFKIYSFYAYYYYFNTSDWFYSQKNFFITSNWSKLDQLVCKLYLNLFYSSSIQLKNCTHAEYRKCI